MRVAYLTAGAGGMYCGSCMRDNTLAAELLRQGRDVVLLPVYSPIRTDEPDVSRRQVYYGGINVYLQQKSTVFRHMPRLFDRILDSGPILRQAMKRAGTVAPEDSAPLVLSILRGEEGAQWKELQKLIEGLRELQPRVVHLPNLFFVGLARMIKRELTTAVVCTLTGEDIYFDKLPQRQQTQARDLITDRSRDIDAFMSVSRYYAGHASAQFGIPAEMIHTVPLGIRVEDGSARPATDRPFTIGYLARICPEKGLHLLCEAFGLLHDQGRACRLVVAGYLGEGDRRYLQEIRGVMRERGLADHVEIRGEVDRAEKLRLLSEIDVFSVPTVYREAKGLYVLEAMCQGAPVVLPRHGAFPELIESTGGGLLVEPNDTTALADALASLMDDPARRQQFANRGRESVRSSHTAEIMAERVWRVFESCLA